MDEKDVRGFIKRDEFEQISIPILERVKGPLEEALLDVGLLAENIHAIEVVGLSSRVPAIIRILTKFFGKEPKRTMNASECMALDNEALRYLLPYTQAPYTQFW